MLMEEEDVAGISEQDVESTSSVWRQWQSVHFVLLQDWLDEA